ncbi:MAG: sporulation transcriptional regulator SpoIIID [Ruminococcaceae bacterium]|nr:sporulation transcriptional regulator SpoIIID [Oscillospiraceae bacterium]
MYNNEKFTGQYDERAIELGRYIAETNSTVRATGKKFGVSKSTVHTDVTVRLRKINPALYNEVRQVLEKNKEERHIRGGIATKEKYLNKVSK